METNAVSRRNVLNQAMGVSAGAAVLAATRGVHAGEAQAPPQDPEAMARAGRVVVTPEGPKDGGHFGKHTPGTKTSGLQEAFDYAKAHRKDMYITGGAMPKQFVGGAVYELHETLRIPWMQDFRLDGGEYNLVYTRPSGSAVILDSQMNCRYKFGKINAPKSDGAVVHLKPETKGPDNFSVITGSVFDFNVVIGAGGAWPGEGVRGKGTGILIDSSTGGVHYNKIFAIEAVGCDRGVHAAGPASVHNEIQVIFSHICNTHMRIGDPGVPSAFNTITMNFVDSENIAGSIGVDLFGHHNLLTVNVARTAEGKNIVFEPEARDNLVVALNLPNGITNHATVPTNRIVSCAPAGLRIETPTFPAHEKDVTNRHPHAVEVLFVTPGTVSDWTLTDAAGIAQSVRAGLFAGQTLTLQPGEKFRCSYKAAPTWRWKALV